MAEPAFGILPIDEIPAEEIVAALEAGLERPFTVEWFNWKHRNSPFGPSLGWVARGPSGILGVRLLMRWHLRYKGSRICAVRPVDTVTLPEARRQGVFRTLTLAAVDACVKQGDIGLIFNTPNAKSRPGYAKMGWTILPPLRHGIVFAGWGSCATLEDSGVFEVFDRVSVEPETLQTERSAAYMCWRYAGQAGRDYRWARLAQADEPNAIIYRVQQRRGIRLLSVCELVGTPREARQLALSAARSEGATVLLMAVGAGAEPIWRPGFVILRGASYVAVRPLPSSPPGVTSLTAWALTLGDLEQVL